MRVLLASQKAIERRASVILSIIPMIYRDRAGFYRMEKIRVFEDLRMSEAESWVLKMISFI